MRYGMHHFKLTEPRAHFEIPGDASSVYLDLAKIFPEGAVHSAQHDNPDLVRAASVSKVPREAAGI